MAQKYEIYEVKQAASGRWPELIGQLGNLGTDQMDPKKHQPCPQCGGTDRFRVFDDFGETGGMLCNKCGTYADGFSAIRWLTGKDFGVVLADVAKAVGIKPKTKNDPAKDLEFRSWSTGFATFFCKAKGISEESLKASGAKHAKYKKNYTVFAFPILGETLDPENPVGWVMANYNGGDLPKWDKNGRQVGSTKYKIAYGSKSGIVGLHAVERLKASGCAELAWKVEGISDMLALWDAIPEQLRDKVVVVTTANGTMELPRWQAGLLGQVNTNVVHDADEPGQAGAKRWSEAIATQAVDGKCVRNVVLPYTIEETKGKDLRDWFAENNKYIDLEALAESIPIVQVAKTETGEVDRGKPQEDNFPMQAMIMKKLGIEVLYEEANGNVRIFSSILSKTSTVSQLDRLGIAKLIQVCGPVAMSVVSKEPDYIMTYALEDIRKAIAFYASLRRGKNDERGVGIWQGLDDYGHETETIVLVNESEAARWNGDKVLRKVVAPRIDGLVLDFGAGGRDWFEFELLERHMEHAADPQWRKDVIMQCYNFLAKWKWKNPHYDPMLVTGLILASWVETVWALRPMVSVSGETNCGKSYLFEALGGHEHRPGIFGRLAFYQEKSSEAGIRQLGIGNFGKIVLCDEFEQSKDRQKTLEMFRAASRGGLLIKGTSDQKGMEFRIRHIAWIAAIESGLHRKPDLNRFIQLQLLTPPREDHGKLVLPDGDWLYQLGQKMLAISVRCVLEAKKLAVALKSTPAPGIDARTVECYAVPAAMLGVAHGYDVEATRDLLLDIVADVNADEQGESDQQELLETILGARVYCGPSEGNLTVAQILEPPRSNRYYDNADRLAAEGIRLYGDDEHLFIVHKQIKTGLLKGTTWEKQRIDQVLERLPNAERTRFHVSGRHSRGILVPDWEDAAEQPPKKEDPPSGGGSETTNGFAW